MKRPGETFGRIEATLGTSVRVHAARSGDLFDHSALMRSTRLSRDEYRLETQCAKVIPAFLDECAQLVNRRWIAPEVSWLEGSYLSQLRVEVLSPDLVRGD